MTSACADPWRRRADECPARQRDCYAAQMCAAIDTLTSSPECGDRVNHRSR
jgi:hypothetical protein